jgi:response regulator of citrate/malate metabolism
MEPTIYEQRHIAERRKNILVVEDDMTLKILWQQIIKKLEYPALIHWATSEGTARKAIDEMKAKGGHFDVVVCDIFLSGNNTGIDLWRSFRGEPTEFIFTSGVSEDKFKKLLEKENGFHMFLPKPLEPRTCIAALNTALKKNWRTYGERKSLGVG